MEQLLAIFQRFSGECLLSRELISTVVAGWFWDTGDFQEEGEEKKYGRAKGMGPLADMTLEPRLVRIAAASDVWVTCRAL
jgi:hypothetical protein